LLYKEDPKIKEFIQISIRDYGAVENNPKLEGKVMTLLGDILKMGVNEISIYPLVLRINKGGNLLLGKITLPRGTETGLG